MPPQIVSKVQLMVLTVPGASQWAKDQWAERLKAMAEYMDESMKLRIPNANAFSALLAGPSGLGYSNVINPNFVSRSGLSAEEIAASQGFNLADAYDKFIDQWNYVFEEVDGVVAKRFKEQVDRAKEVYSQGVAKKTLPFTGANRYFKGISSLAGMWLTNDPRVEGYLRAGDEMLIGGPKLICTESAKPNLRTLLNQRLIQSGATLVKQNWSGTAITKQNDQTNAQASGLRDPMLNIVAFTTGGESHIDWIRIDDKPYLEIQVGITP